MSLYCSGDHFFLNTVILTLPKDQTNHKKWAGLYIYTLYSNIGMRMDIRLYMRSSQVGNSNGSGWVKRGNSESPVNLTCPSIERQKSIQLFVERRRNFEINVHWMGSRGGYTPERGRMCECVCVCM